MGQLNSCPRCGASLSDSTLDGLCPACAAGAVLALAAGSVPDAALAASSADAAGERSTDFGEFELLEEIARGGMGVVYKARQKRLNRLVALKMILAGRFAGGEQVKRFRAEAEAAASLRHPNIVAIHDVGEVAGQHYFCMDLIEGPNLAGLVRDHPLAPQKAAQLVQEVAQAVQYAHGHGVVHRDLKPANIIIDQEGRPHVTDFGLAKRLSGDSDMTQSGQMLGSPNFAAPEQAGGRSHEAGPRSDVYSLGAILYYLLVGRPPFLAESVERTLSMVVSSDPIAPRKLDPGVPRDLETICLKCLEKDPARRYATAGLLADELGRCLRGEPIQARPIGAPEKLLRWTRRNRTVALLTAFAALMLLLGVSGVLWQWRRADRSARSESKQRTRAEATVARLQWQQAEESLAQDNPYPALGHLAQTLRQSPTNEAVAERILSILSQRRFALPVTPPLRHGGPVSATAFSKDGSQVATASMDGTAFVWEASSGRRLIGPLLHGGPVNAVQFSRDDSLLLTASEDGGIRIWETATGQERARFQHESNAVTLAEFDPEGRFVIAATRDQYVTVWALESGTRSFPPVEHASRVSAARFSPDGGRFLTASHSDGLVRVFDSVTGREIHSFKFNGWILSARFSPDGRRIAVASYQKWASIWTLGGTPGFVTVWHDGVVNDASLSPDGLLLATISRDRRALVWDSRTGDLIFSLPTHLTWAEETAFGPDGLILLTREQGNRVVIWDLLNGRPQVEPIQTPTLLRGALGSPDGRRVLLGAIDGTAQLWRVEPAGNRPLQLGSQSEAVTVDFSSDGRQLAVGTRDGSVTVWDAIHGLPEKTFKHQGRIYTVQFSPDALKVLTASSDKTARLWDLGTGASLTLNHDQRVIHAELSPDGRALVTASFDGTARIWSAETAQPLSEPMRHPGRLWHAAFSPDGRLTATACDDTQRGTDHHARIWDASNGRPVTPPLRHAQQVYRVSFDPTGAFLATASADNTAVLWAVASGERLREFKHNGPVRHVVFSPKGDHLLTASQDNTARIWDIKTGEPIGEPMRHDQEVDSAVWRSDGRRVATASDSGFARVWDAMTGRPTTEPLQHFRLVGWPRFSPDGRRLACPARQACIWDLPMVAGEPAGWLPDLAEAVAGKRLRASPNRGDPTPGDLYELGRKLTSAAGHDPMKGWARWFFEDRFIIEPRPRLMESAAETPSPGVEFEDQTRASTVEAIHARPTNALAWSRLFKLTRTQRMQDNPFRDAQAEYYSRKTAALAPGVLAHWLERLEWLTASKRTELFPETLEDAMRHHPASAQLHWRQAQWLDHSGKLAEAASVYRKVLDLETNRLDANHVRSANRRRDLLVQLGAPGPAQEEWLRAKDIPRRPDDLPASCIDLAAHYNAALDEPWHDRKRQGNDLSQVPPGRFVARQIMFDVRGIVQLAGKYLDRVEPGFPQVVKGMKVGRACDKLHFLHAAGWGYTVPNETVVARYVVHYSDGATEVVPLKRGVDLNEWFQQGPAPLADLLGAQTVDLGRNAATYRVRLFLQTWRNPRPAVPVATIDFATEMTGAAPFLVGLTVEP